MDMNQMRMGKGKPLLLIHGLGGSWRSWRPILDPLAVERQVIAIDLPGFGESPPLPGEVSIASLADAVTSFLRTNSLMGVDMVGSSMGARLVLELARRGVAGTTISLDPGGFWKGWERTFFATSIRLSIRLVRMLQPVIQLFTGNPVGRTILFSQFSPRPWHLSPVVTFEEMRSYAASPSFDELLRSLVDGPTQQGSLSTPKPIIIGWGRNDRVCLPRQADRALDRFPEAHLHWFDHCGHFPQWDVPQQTVQLILQRTS
jgi:pimeloyl-ACP methyl ester carboxylesterase